MSASRLRLVHKILLAALTVTPAAAVEPQDLRRGQPCADSALESLCWNGRARQLVVNHGLDPASASRVYAVLSLAQYRAATADGGTIPLDSTRKALERRAAVEEASEIILRRLFPLREADSTLVSKRLSRRGSGRSLPVGRAAALWVLQRVTRDGSEASHNVEPPMGPGVWRSQEDRPPLRPYWGNVLPLVITYPDSFLPPPPPLWGSARFKEAIDEVLDITSNLSEREHRTAEYWDDALATPTPAGHWNVIAAELIEESQLDEEQAARVLATMNVAMMDAGIVCWRSKYTHWVARPSQLDSAIRMVIKVPNFPAYPSGHAAFSAAAAAVLGRFFPESEEKLRSMAEEAAMSRIYGGIHYRFDADAGLLIGRTVAERVMAAHYFFSSETAVNGHGDHRRLHGGRQ